MADRVVYLVEEITRHHTQAEVAFVDDAGLGQLLAEGFEITSTLPDRKVKANGKTVKAAMIMLRPAAENRGVSTREQPEYQRDSEGRNLVVVNDEFGLPRSMTPAQATMQAMTKALSRIGDVGHLGGARDHNIPGLTIISGEMIGKAFDIGTLAGARGDSEDTNPFPGGTAPHTRWIEGFRKYHESTKTQPVTGDVALQEAEAEGYGLAQSLGPKDVVHCPYLNGNPMKRAWLDGFRRGGGVIENT